MAHERLNVLRILLVGICLMMLIIGPYDSEYHTTSALMFRPLFPFPFFPFLGLGFLWLKVLALLLGVLALVAYKSKFTLPMFTLLYATLNYYIHCFQGHYCLNHIHLVVGLTAVSIAHFSKKPESASFVLTFMGGYIALLFFQAGIAKLLYGGLGWFSSGDTLYVETILDGTDFGRWFTQFAWFFPLMGMAVAIFELVLPFAFLFRALHPFYGAVLLLFHLGTFVAMGISFWFLWPLYFPLFRPQCLLRPT